MLRPYKWYVSSVGIDSGGNGDADVDGDGDVEDDATKQQIFINLCVINWTEMKAKKKKLRF